MKSKNRKIGYARVSTADQNLDLQVTALIKYGVHPDLIFTDKLSGGTLKRPGLTKALKFAQYPDTEFVVWKLDRLGRTMLGIIEMLQVFDQRDIHLVSLTEGFDMGTPFGKAMVGFLAVFAELERDMIRERTMAGLAAARERGEVAGRPNAMTEERVAKAIEMLGDGKTAKDILPVLQKMEGPSIGRSRVFTWIKDYRMIEPEDNSDLR